jgi:predicted PurR-regulated permease PerM
MATPPRRGTRWALFGICGALTLLLLWQVRAHVSPFLTVTLLGVLLLAGRREAWALPLAFVGGVSFLAWFVLAAGGIFLPFLIAFALAYAFDPVIDRIEARGLSRTWSVVLFSIPAALVFLVIPLLLIPPLVGELQTLASQAPRLSEWIRDLYVNVVEWLGRLRLGVDQEAVRQFAFDRAEGVLSALPGFLFRLVRGLTNVFSLVSFFVITPVVTFYMLKDIDRLRSWTASLLPPEREEIVRRIARDVDLDLSRYLRGQLLVCLVVGTLTAGGLLVLGAPYALLLGVVTGILNFVPYVGLAVSLALAVLATQLASPGWVMLVKVIAVFVVVQSLENTVVSPRVLGRQTGLHPVMVMIALVVGGYYFGFAGLLLAIPVTVALKVLSVEALGAYRAEVLGRKRRESGFEPAP